MAKKLVLSFMTAQNTTSSISLDEPKDGLTAAEVRPVMELIITENAFNTSKGDLTEVKKAEIISTTKETLI